LGVFRIDAEGHVGSPPSNPDVAFLVREARRSMKVQLFCSTVALFAAVLLLGSSTAGEKDDKPKYEIKEVMKKAMKGGLCKKVAEGEASADEKNELVEYFTALNLNTPPKGEKASWTKKTATLLAAAKGAAKGDEKALKTLASVNCGACHKEFKK
jgi:cytochrome c556